MRGDKAYPCYPVARVAYSLCQTHKTINTRLPTGLSNGLFQPRHWYEQWDMTNVNGILTRENG